jgi:hypothetical protein
MNVNRLRPLLSLQTFGTKHKFSLNGCLILADSAETAELSCRCIPNLEQLPSSSHCALPTTSPPQNTPLTATMRSTLARRVAYVAPLRREPPRPTHDHRRDLEFLEDNC